jgi:type II pantothenate kinase
LFGDIILLPVHIFSLHIILFYFILFGRSKGEAKAMFLRHEGFLGALGAFMSYERHSLGDLMVNQSVQIPVDASSSTDTNYNPLERDLNETESMQCSVYQA